ncbi:MAG: hypothetical protein JW963_15690 [Anaerolineales bacterium]|nr:hypothetical protein [Anaerolineales bacterium]
MGRTIVRRLLYLVVVLLVVSVITFGLMYAVPDGPLACEIALAGEKGAEGFAEQVVYDLIAAKLEAMQAQDIERYLALIDETDKEYYTEQRNWFLIYQDADTADFSIRVLKAAQIDDSTIVATLCQRYLYGPKKENRTVKYEAKFVETPDGWKDADLNFRVMETPHFTIKYPQKAEAKALEVSEAAENAYASVIKELGFEAQSKTTVKLYADRKMVRETTDIRVAYLFNGWGEAGESIKMYAYRKGSAEILIAHELVHKITLEITDSQTAWLAEGLAVYFGDRPFEGGNPVQLGSSTAEELSQPTSWLDEKNLALLTDEKTRILYYDMSAMIVEFIVETYGLDKLQAVLVELSKYPRYDHGYDYAMEAELQQRLYQAIETVLGVNKDGFNQQWLAWISSQ